MNKLLSIIISIILSIIAIISVIFLTLNIFKNPKTLPRIAELANYYDEAYPIILDNVKNQVGHDKLKEIVGDVLTKERVTNDIKSTIIFGGKIKDEIGNNIEKDLMNAFRGKLHNNYEKEALTNLVSLVGDTYKETLFPKDEFDSVYKVINKVPYITIIFITSLAIYLIISFIILLFKGYKIVALSNYIVGFIMAVIYLFIHLGNIFSNFYYTNQYWTVFIKKTIFFIINAIGIASIIFIVLGVLVQIIGNKIKK